MPTARGGIRVATKRTSPVELTITTKLASRHGDWSPPLPSIQTNGVTAEYEIHVPRDSRLVIHHSVGYVHISGVELSRKRHFERTFGLGAVFRLVPGPRCE